MSRSLTRLALVSLFVVTALAGPSEAQTGSISGRVTAAEGGTGLSNVVVQVYGSSGAYVTAAATAADGTYATAATLAAGTYYARTSGASPYLDQLYSSLPCPSGGGCTVTSGTPIVLAAGETKAGIDFALVAGARISGTVTAQGSGTPLANVSVNVFNSAGSNLTGVTTAADGRYTTEASLAAGTYYVRASGTSAYVGQVYSNLACPAGFCIVTTGTPIAVATGETKGGIDFALPLGGNFSGNVTLPAGSTSSVQNARVYYYTAAGDSLTNARPDASGYYATVALPAGTYFARIYSGSDYMGQLYSGLFCASSCSVTSGTPITVTVGTTTPGIGFNLKSGGSVAGTVTNQSSGQPIQGASVTLYNSSGNYVGSASTNSSGIYKVGGLLAGTYFVNVSKSQFLAELYDNVPCGSGCQVTSGTPIVLGADEAVAGIDVALSAGGTITGRITGKDTGLGLSGVSVRAQGPQGDDIGYATTDSQGNYSMAGLPTGTLYVLAYGTGNYLGQLYSGVACTQYWCAAAFGTTVSVTAGQTTSGIDLALERGGTISGRVTRTGGVAVSGKQVNIYTTTGASAGYANTNAQGDYSVTLAPGTYSAQVAGTNTLLGETYNNLPCASTSYPGCDPTLGTPIVVTSGGAANGIDFSLEEPPGGTIAGTVTKQTDGTPISGVTVSVLDSLGNTVRSASSDSAGAYVVMGLATGTYLVRTESYSSYVNEVYDNVPCPASYWQCPLTGATPVDVVHGATHSGIDFALLPLSARGSIKGRVTRSAGGAPVVNAQIAVYSASGEWVANDYTDSQGDYEIAGLVSGTYHVQTLNTPGLVDEAYADVACPVQTCEKTAGTGVPVVEGSPTTGIDFALVARAISGRVTDATTGAGLQYVSVGLYNRAGTQLAWSQTDSAGNYLTPGLAAGSYLLRAGRDYEWSHVGEAYDNIPCEPTCDIASATPVVVTADTGASGIDFALTPAGGTSAQGGIAGFITDAATGAPLSGISIQFYDVTNGHSYGGSASANGYYAATYLPQGSYRVVASGGGYIPEVYDDKRCIDRECPSMPAQTVVVWAGAITKGIDFALDRGGTITGHVLEQGTGVLLAGVDIEVYDALGRQVTDHAFTDASGFYRFGGLPPGQYHVVARDNLLVVYPNVVCDPFQCDVTRGTLVRIEAAETKAGIDFKMPRASVVSGRVTRSDTGEGIPGVNVVLFDGGGLELADSETDAAGYYTLDRRLAGGSYYLRTEETPGYVDEYWNDKPCPPTCKPGGAAQALSMSPGTTVSNVDFALAQGGAISGRVVDTISGDAVGQVIVEVVDSTTGVVARSAETDQTGAYVVSGLPAGTYRVRTFGSYASTRFVDELYNNLPRSASPALGTPVVVAGVGTTSGIDFALERSTDFAFATEDDEWVGTGVFQRQTTTWSVENRLDVVLGSVTDRVVPADYDGDREIELASFNPRTGTWTIEGSAPIVWGGPGDVPVPADYDGNGAADIAVFRPATGTWFVRDGLTQGYGLPGDVPVPADYDGDGLAELAVFRPSTGTWYVRDIETAVWGARGDWPVPADFDGDGRADLAVWRPSTGTWYVRGLGTWQLGATGDLPIPFDFNGDRAAEFAVYTPSSGRWLLYFDYYYTDDEVEWRGGPGQTPAWLPSWLQAETPGDEDGDLRADIKVYRPSTGTWFSLQSATGFQTYSWRGWGQQAQGDVPAPGDYDGDGVLDPTVYRPVYGTWFTLTSSSNFTQYTVVGWGNATDVLVQGDYDGDGSTDIAIYRPATFTWYVVPSSTGVGWNVVFGQAGDVPIPGDYDGDGKTDVAVYRPSTGTWFWLKSSVNRTQYDYRGWGVQAQQDTPVPGDYDGDGRTDPTVYRPAYGTWFVLTSSSNYTTYFAFGWGGATDALMPADYDGDRITDAAVFKPATGEWYVLKSSRGFSSSAPDGWFRQVFGVATDVPLPAR